MNGRWKYEIILYAWISNKNSNQNFKINQIEERCFQLHLQRFNFQRIFQFHQVNQHYQRRQFNGKCSNGKVVHSLKTKKTKSDGSMTAKKHIRSFRRFNTSGQVFLGAIFVDVSKKSLLFNFPSDSNIFWCRKTVRIVLWPVIRSSVILANESRNTGTNKKWA